MKFKIYYDKTVKMSKEKLAAQVGHVTLNLGYKVGFNEGYANVEDFYPSEQTIIVLGLSHTKFVEICDKIVNDKRIINHVQIDAGRTEVEPGTITAVGFIEEE